MRLPCIESNGFLFNFRPFDFSDLLFLFEVAKNHSGVYFESIAPLELNLPRYEGVPSSCFTHQFRRALTYSSLIGGESVKNLRGLAQELLSLELDSSIRDRVVSIFEKHQNFNAKRVVYALKIEGDDLLGFNEEILRVSAIIKDLPDFDLYSIISGSIEWNASRNIMADRIVAKYLH